MQLNNQIIKTKIPDDSLEDCFIITTAIIGIRTQDIYINKTERHNRLFTDAWYLSRELFRH